MVHPKAERGLSKCNIECVYDCKYTIQEGFGFENNAFSDSTVTYIVALLTSSVLCVVQSPNKVGTVR